MELSPSWEAANCAATQERLSILTNPNVHYRVHKSPTPISSLSQNNPVHNTPNYSSKIQFSILSTDLRLGLHSGLFPSGIRPNILYAFRFSSFRATCPLNLILLDFIILIILGEAYKLRNSSNFKSTHIRNLIYYTSLWRTKICKAILLKRHLTSRSL
jgi:hypothetical protein